MEWISKERWMQLAGEHTDAHRVATGGDGWIDRYADWILETRNAPSAACPPIHELTDRYAFRPRGWLCRDLARDAKDQSPAYIVEGESPGPFFVRENGLLYEVDLAAGYSSGLFLDQRENRRWAASLKPRRMLNLFAYTGSFSVAAAALGASSTSVDVSKRGLAVARRNFQANRLDADNEHRFVAEDVMKYLPRLRKRGEVFDLIVIDPPTFGRADGRVFRIERDLPQVLAECGELLETGGWLLVSCNFAKWCVSDLQRVFWEVYDKQSFAVSRGELPREIPAGAISLRCLKL